MANVEVEKLINERVKQSMCYQQLVNSAYTPAPAPRPWIVLQHLNASETACTLSLMSYNVLSSSYASSTMYSYCPEEHLRWENRGPAIIREIEFYDCDVVSLQEVECAQFTEFFLPLLRGSGYDGIFAPKSRARTMSYPKSRMVDGCAIFFKVEKCSLVSHELIEFNQLAGQYYDPCSADMVNRVMRRDNIGLFAVLKTTAAAWSGATPPSPHEVEKLVVVAATHLHWDPECCDVKLIQAMMLSRAISNKLEEVSSSSGLAPSDIKLLLCGDFNSKPDSGVFEFLVNGRVAANHQDFLNLDYTAAIDKMLGRDINGDFCHQLQLSSAISEDTMKYTNYTYDFKAVIDYIFYSNPNVKLLGVTGSFSEDWLRNNQIVGCPHPHIPSDHFPLIALFRI